MKNIGLINFCSFAFLIRLLCDVVSMKAVTCSFEEKFCSVSFLGTWNMEFKIPLHIVTRKTFYIDLKKTTAK